MMILIVLLYLAAAAGGLYLLSFVFRKQMIPQKIAHIHGAVAATATALFAIYVSSHEGTPKTALILFIGAACGGLYMLFKDRAGEQFPKYVPYVHGGVALLALVMLLILAF
jgi:hypothetical protein